MPVTDWPKYADLLQEVDRIDALNGDYSSFSSAVDDYEDGKLWGRAGAFDGRGLEALFDDMGENDESARVLRLRHATEARPGGEIAGFEDWAEYYLRPGGASWLYAEAPDALDWTPVEDAYEEVAESEEDDSYDESGDEQSADEGDADQHAGAAGAAADARLFDATGTWVLDGRDWLEPDRPWTTDDWCYDESGAMVQVTAERIAGAAPGADPAAGDADAGPDLIAPADGPAPGSKAEAQQLVREYVDAGEVRLALSPGPGGGIDNRKLPQADAVALMASKGIGIDALFETLKNAWKADNSTKDLSRSLTTVADGLVQIGVSLEVGIDPLDVQADENDPDSETITIYRARTLWILPVAIGFMQARQHNQAVLPGLQNGQTMNAVILDDVVILDPDGYQEADLLNKALELVHQETGSALERHTVRRTTHLRNPVLRTTGGQLVANALRRAGWTHHVTSEDAHGVNLV